MAMIWAKEKNGCLVLETNRADKDILLQGKEEKRKIFFHC